MAEKELFPGQFQPHADMIKECSNCPRLSLTESDMVVCTEKRNFLTAPGELVDVNQAHIELPSEVYTQEYAKPDWCCLKLIVYAYDVPEEVV